MIRCSQRSLWKYSGGIYDYLHGEGYDASLKEMDENLEGGYGLYQGQECKVESQELL